MENVDLLWASASQLRLKNVSLCFSSHWKVFFLWTLSLWRNICLPLFFLQFSICAYFLSLTFAICKRNSLVPALFADCLTFCCLSVSTHILAPLLFCFSALFLVFCWFSSFFSRDIFISVLKREVALKRPCLSFLHRVCRSKKQPFLFWSGYEKTNIFTRKTETLSVSVYLCVCFIEKRVTQQNLQVHSPSRDWTAHD